jgi:hypothetical protein
MTLRTVIFDIGGVYFSDGTRIVIDTKILMMAYSLMWLNVKSRIP